jgi:glutamate-ammonia-ligase adenylyltransferase
MPAPAIDPSRLPRPYDPAHAARTIETLASDGYVPEGAARALLESAFGNSPYLARLAWRERQTLRDFFASGPKAIADRANDRALSVATMSDDAAAMTALRVAKREAALAIALADIAELWDVGTVTRALSAFADAAVKGALRFLLAKASGGGDGARLEAETGLIVLAMGKYGAFELNYSSDIDLIVFYETDRFPFRKRDDARGAAVDIVRGLVRLLSEITTDGYVFRVDLRLRPDAGATQVAISTDAAEAYYEEMGQNWERAAMIKVRPCAGAPGAGARFMKAIEPFIWRRNLDFAAIEDIHSIKRQIHAHEGHAEIAVAGHNIKLGRGGIREIEFFAQTQQLILGGRDPSLRSRETLPALDALAARGLVAKSAATELKAAYLFLRRLEHRLQMIDDEQTHTIPKSPEGLAHVACFAGFATVEDFSRALTRELETVQDHYARLFEREQELSGTEGNLVFTGVEDDPDTIATLKRMGYRNPEHVARAVRGWHHGRIRATRSARARELLTKLMPALLGALAATADPDAAFAQFDRFLTNLPAGVQLFSLFLAQPDLLRLVAGIVGSAPRLAEHLGRAPATLDALLDPGFLGELPARHALDALLANQIGSTRDYEAILDAARRFAKEQIFRVGVQVIEGAARADEAGPAFAEIAETVISGLLAAAGDAIAAGAGRIPGGAFAVIAMGRLGGREMTAGSDLDLIFVYDTPAGVEQSDGARPLPVTTYYARLAQRLIAALTVQTGAGGLYEVDMRLRPTGNKGPVAVSLESFKRYHASQSWTWERMALTRARVIAAPETLKSKVEDAIATTLRASTDPKAVMADARDMREKLAAQFSTRNRWDLKFAAGGLVDIEFIAQTLQLLTATRTPAVLHRNTIAALKALASAGALSAEDAKALVSAAALQQALTQVLRIALDGTLDPATATPGLRNLLASATGEKDFAALETRLAAAQRDVRAVYERVMR